MNVPAPARPRARPLVWEEQRGDWPHAEASRFEEAGGLRWHVQQMGRGPVVLLVHGTGASTHSWRDLAPRLAAHFTVVALDLPGHGFTGQPARRRLSLPGMAAAVGALAAQLDLRPALAVGHSAGAAILVRCCMDGLLAPDGVVGINAALLPFRGAAGFLYPPLAKLLFLNPLTPRMLARGACERERVRRLIQDTGSRIDEQGMAMYARLLTSPEHVGAALGMVANWDLRRFARDLPSLRSPLLLIVGENDRAVSPDDAERVRGMVADARVERVAGLGHLAHEEDPDRVAEAIVRFAGDAAGERFDHERGA